MPLNKETKVILNFSHFLIFTLTPVFQNLYAKFIKLPQACNTLVLKVSC